MKTAEKNQTQEKTLMNQFILLSGKLDEYLSICTFYHESLRRLAAENELTDKSKINLGMTLTGNWVSNQGDKLLQSFNDLEDELEASQGGEQSA